MSGYGASRGSDRDRYADYGPPAPPGPPGARHPPGYGYAYGPRPGDYPPPPAAARGGWGLPPAAMPHRGSQPGKTTLFVAGFPAEMRAADLAYYFERLGPLVRCDIPALRTQQAKPYAFIEYEDPRDAAAAHAEMHGVRFGGSAISIQFAKNSPSSKWRFDGPRAPPPPLARGNSSIGGARRCSLSPRRGATNSAEDRYRGRDERDGDRRRGGERVDRDVPARGSRDDKRPRDGDARHEGKAAALASDSHDSDRAAHQENAETAAAKGAGGNAEAANAMSDSGWEPDGEAANGTVDASGTASAIQANSGSNGEARQRVDDNTLTPPPAATAVDDDDEAEPVDV